jgi:hypothetical protein
MAQSLSANLSYKENVNVAYDNSFVLINNNVRPLYAQATYLANASDITLNAGSLSIDLTTIENDLDNIQTQLVPLTAVRNIPGFSIPEYDQVDMEYVGSTDILRRVYYKKNSTQVFSLSFGYITEPPTAGNAIIKGVKRV